MIYINLVCSSSVIQSDLYISSVVHCQVFFIEVVIRRFSEIVDLLSRCEVAKTRYIIECLSSSLEGYC